MIFLDLAPLFVKSKGRTRSSLWALSTLSITLGHIQSYLFIGIREGWALTQIPQMLRTHLASYKTLHQKKNDLFRSKAFLPVATKGSLSHSKIPK